MVLQVISQSHPHSHTDPWPHSSCLRAGPRDTDGHLEVWRPPQPTLDFRISSHSPTPREFQEQEQSAPRRQGGAGCSLAWSRLWPVFMDSCGARVQPSTALQSISTQKVHKPQTDRELEFALLVCNIAPTLPPGLKPTEWPESSWPAQRGPTQGPRFKKANSVECTGQPARRTLLQGGRPALSTHVPRQGCSELGEHFPWTPI